MKKIENHKKAVKHLEEAVKYHHEAIKLHEAEYNDEEYLSTLKAHGETVLSLEAQKEILKEYSLEK